MASTPSVKLIACSLDRTLLARPSPSGGAELVKVYERGSLADAEAEASFAARIAVPGVVRYRGANRDAGTGRPCVIMDYHEGQDLERWLAERGPPPLGVALRTAHGLARILAALHALRTSDTPHGVVHRDV